MITVGLSAPRLRHFGLTTHQFIADPDVIEAVLRAEGSTRAVQAMRLAWRRGLPDGALVGSATRRRACSKSSAWCAGGRASGADHRYAGGLVSAAESKRAIGHAERSSVDFVSRSQGRIRPWWSPRCMACCRWPKRKRMPPPERRGHDRSDEKMRKATAARARQPRAVSPPALVRRRRREQPPWVWSPVPYRT